VDRNVSIGIPSSPTNNMRFGLNCFAKMSMPGWLIESFPLLTSIAMSFSPSSEVSNSEVAGDLAGSP
jgi:hypothetical protein